MQNDPISDFLTRIRNAQAARHETVSLPGSRLKLAVAKVLVSEGFLADAKQTAEGPKKTLVVTLKYLGKLPLIRSIVSVSTPGRRVYRKSTELPRVLSGQGIRIISTSAGVMSDREARKRKLGGEIICEVS